MSSKIAVVGMACRFPGAKNKEEYWDNLINGRETITHFGDDDLKEFELNWESLRNNPDFVKARGILADVDKFDPSFFGMTPLEAAATDPQQRVWLQTAWEAFEDAGIDPFNFKGSAGVFAGASFSTYLLNNLLRDPLKRENFIKLRSAETFQYLISNDPGFIATRTAYKFNLKGPAISVQTACSTSLVAIAQACQSLYSFESDICLAGGVCITVPQENGYIYQEGSILSPDGHCRPFDARAKGTVASNGVGAVVLKRLEDAEKDGDNIYAVVRGWALNNDGNTKMSYTAPSIEGQAEVIMMAQAFAEVTPDQIGYIEAHGTATQLGDPVEVAGLTRAFSAKTDKKQFCGIGSVKSNIGHTDTAAGVAAFIKSCLIAREKLIPRTLNYESPNSHIDFENSPFYVQDENKSWTGGKPLILGVSSFGIGGTNAHAIIEEPPLKVKISRTSAVWPELVVLSAKSETSLTIKKENIAGHLKANREIHISDVAWSLLEGRNHMKFRCFKVASSIDEITDPATPFIHGIAAESIAGVAFLFPGQGAQYISMGKNLYNSDNTFRKIVDECFAIYREETGNELASILFPPGEIPGAKALIDNTAITQPVLFIIEYALAKMLEQLGIKPSIMIGHSIGEYVAACLSGVFSLADTMRIVIKRGALMSKIPCGEMIVTRASAATLEKLKNGLFEIAADNADEACTICFKPINAAIVKKLLDENNIQYLKLDTSHAFHSSDFDPILDEFAHHVEKFHPTTPQIPFISCLTGRMIEDYQATSGRYWADQLRNTVHFREGISTICSEGKYAFIEVGPNTHLGSILRQHSALADKKMILATLAKNDGTDERYKIMTLAGNLFNLGLLNGFTSMNLDSEPSKIKLPAYPFERIRCWIEFKTDGAGIGNNPGDGEEIQFTSGNKMASESVKLNDPTSLTTAGKVLTIWKKLFGLEHIDPDENFFDIGGHSLLALQILNRVKEYFHHEIPLRTFLETPTINGLCNLITGDGMPDDEIQIEHTNDLSRLPLSNEQKRLWILYRFDNKNPAYNIPFTYLLDGELDRQVFSESIRILFERHHIIFSTFHQDGEEAPYCTITPRTVEIEFIDFSNALTGTSEAKIHTFIGEDSRRPFDLEAGPLFRLYLLKRGNNLFYFHATFSHMVFDGWTWGVFVSDLNKIYNSLVLKEKPDLDDLTVQYYDYARWQAAGGRKLNEKKLSDFWAGYLNGIKPLLNFPFDKSRAVDLTGIGYKEYIAISPIVASRLRDICKSENSTMFATLLSAFGVLMYKYSGDMDICIGTPVSYRPESRLENIAGMFINTTVIRVLIDPSKSFTDLVRNVRYSSIDAISHQEFPFEKIVETVNPTRTFNTNPIFQVCFAWQNNLSLPLHLKDLRGERVTIAEGVAPFDLTFYMWENGDIIEGEIEFSSGLLCKDTIDRLRNNFICILESFASDPGIVIGKHDFIDDKEKDLILSFSGNTTDYPRHKNIISLFEEQVKRFPGKNAVVFKDEKITYSGLDERSDQLAALLISKGVVRNAPVAIVATRRLETVLGILGILKAGGAYLPVDPDCPGDRVLTILKDSGCKILLAAGNYRLNSRHPITRIDPANFENVPPANIKSTDQPMPDDPAYIMYTSGTTGVPKGSLIPQKGVVRLVKDTNYISLTHNDRILMTGSLTFDASTFEIWGALLNGGTLYIATKETILDPRALGEELIKNDITVLWLTSGLFTQISEVRRDIFSKLKWLLVGGDVLSAPHINRVRKENPLLKVVNGYGPTENTTFSTTYLIDKDYDHNIPIGKPVSNSTAYIFDRNLHLQPIGVKGELYVGGAGVSLGYVNREDLNSKCFISNPYNPGERLYRTGDYARWLPDGNIEFCGRVDTQLKIRGFRVEIEEIESVISGIEGVIGTVVRPVRTDNGDINLVAFLNVSDTFKADHNDVIIYVKQRLPVYMIPSAIRFMKGFPMTINGKIDREALVYDIKVNEMPEKEVIKNLTPTETIIFNIWSEVLKTNKFSIKDNFFEIGGNSLLAINVFAKIESRFKSNLGIRMFFDSPRIKDLAELIDVKINEKNEKTGKDEISIKSGDCQIVTGDI